MRRWAFSYGVRSPATIASTRAADSWSATASPSPVMASRYPAASPTRATLPRRTARTRWWSGPVPRSRDEAGALGDTGLQGRKALQEIVEAGLAAGSRGTRSPPGPEPRESRRPRIPVPSRPRRSRSRGAWRSGAGRRSGGRLQLPGRAPPSRGPGSAGRPRPRSSAPRRSPARVSTPSDPSPEALTPQRRSTPTSSARRTKAPCSSVRRTPSPPACGNTPSARTASVEVADPPEGEAPGLDADLPQARHGVRHQPFAAGLVDGRAGTVEDGHGHPREPGADGRGEPRRAAADHHKVCLEIGETHHPAFLRFRRMPA